MLNNIKQIQHLHVLVVTVTEEGLSYCYEANYIKEGKQSKPEDASGSLSSPVSLLPLSLLPHKG